MIILTNLLRLGKIQKGERPGVHNLTENLTFLWDLPPEISATVYAQGPKETAL